MLCAFDGKLEDLVTECFLESPSWSADAILKQLQNRDCPCTIQAIYQELRKLRKLGVVSKKQSTFVVNLGWLGDLRKRVNQGYGLAIEQPALPVSGAREVFEFRNAEELLSLWSHLTLGILSTVKTPILTEWAPHLWYHLVQVSYESRFWKRFQALKAVNTVWVGGKTELDKSYADLIPKKLCEINFGVNPKWVQPNEHISVCVPYTMKVTFSPERVRILRNIFSNSFKKADRQSIAKEIGLLRNGPGKIRLRIENNEKKAVAIVRKFEGVEREFSKN